MAPAMTVPATMATGGDAAVGHSRPPLVYPLAAPARACKDPPWLQLLIEAGANRIRHRNRTSLLEHLTATERILGAWGQPALIRSAGGLHSIYGTEFFRTKLIDHAARDKVAAHVGAAVERLAFLFCTINRADLFTAVGDGIPAATMRLDGEFLTPDEMAALVLMHMANLLEQATVNSPEPWLWRLLAWGRLLRPARDVVPPFIALCPELTDRHEAALQTAYLQALADLQSGNVTAADQGLAFARTLCRGLPEPWLWSAATQLRAGNFSRAAEYAALAKRLSASWGSTWDKRLSLSQARQFATDLQHLAVQGSGTDLPWADLHDQAGFAAAAQQVAPALTAENIDAENMSGRVLDHQMNEQMSLPPRFSAYLAAVLAKRGRRMPRYPGLAATPWHDADAFPIVTALEQSFDKIREEVLGISTFQIESEPIERTGLWEVAFLYECGLRNRDICGQCPTLAAVIDAFPTVQTLAGLAYVSRLAPGTSIKPHRANSTIRLRCHLAIKVPAAGSGICVDGEARTWEEGKCLVFDDCFSHHAWNHGDQERIVVVIDLWHPGLEPQEIQLLAQLHRHIENQANWLTRYRSSNAKARLQADELRVT